jgi:hypothetical protein
MSIEAGLLGCIDHGYTWISGTRRKKRREPWKQGNEDHAECREKDEATRWAERSWRYQGRGIASRVSGKDESYSDLRETMQKKRTNHTREEMQLGTEQVSGVFKEDVWRELADPVEKRCADGIR